MPPRNESCRASDGRSAAAVKARPCRYHQTVSTMVRNCSQENSQGVQKGKSEGCHLHSHHKTNAAPRSATTITAFVLSEPIPLICCSAAVVRSINRLGLPNTQTFGRQCALLPLNRWEYGDRKYLLSTRNL